MKKKRGIQINFSNRWLYTFIVLGILVVISVSVYAFGTSNPSSFGHSPGEIDFSQTITEDITTTGKITANEICVGGKCNSSLLTQGRGVYEVTNSRCDGAGGITFSSTCQTSTCGGTCQSYYVYRYNCAGSCICATSGIITCPNTIQGYLVN